LFQFGNDFIEIFVDGEISLLRLLGNQLIFVVVPNNEVEQRAGGALPAFGEPLAWNHRTFVRPPNAANEFWLTRNRHVTG
jgi:hypothetical protein